MASFPQSKKPPRFSGPPTAFRNLTEVLRIENIAIGGEDRHLSAGTIPIGVASLAIRELHDQRPIGEAVELVAVPQDSEPDQLDIIVGGIVFLRLADARSLLGGAVEGSGAVEAVDQYDIGVEASSDPFGRRAGVVRGIVGRPAERVAPFLGPEIRSSIVSAIKSGVASVTVPAEPAPIEKCGNLSTIRPSLARWPTRGNAGVQSVPAGQ